jgi:hypothetical protein
VINNLRNTINGNLDFDTNFRSQFVSVEFAATNTDTEINHSLGKRPRGYIIINSNEPMNVYDGNEAFQINKLVLRSDATGGANLLIF